MQFEQCARAYRLYITVQTNRLQQLKYRDALACVAQVNNKISGLSSLRWRCVVRFLNKLTCNTQARPWSLVSILALLHDVYNKLVVFVSNFYILNLWQLQWYDL